MLHWLPCRSILSEWSPCPFLCACWPEFRKLDWIGCISGSCSWKLLSKNAAISSKHPSSCLLPSLVDVAYCGELTVLLGLFCKIL